MARLCSQLRRPLLADTINRPEDIWLGELRAGTTEFIPAAGIHHDQTAIGVFQHVGGMKVHAVGNEEIAVRAGVGGAFEAQDVARDLVQVEGRGEEVVTVFSAKDRAFVAAQAAFGGVAGLVKRVHQLRTGAFHPAVFQRIMLLPEHSAVNRVRNAVTVTGLAEVNERAGEDGFAFRREGDFNRVVHAAGHDEVQVRAIGPRTINVRRAVVDLAAIAKGVRLLSEGAFRPVEVAVRAEVRTVDVIRAARERAALEPLLAFVGNAVTVGVGKLPDARRASDINRAGVPKAALGEHDFVGEHD